MDLTLRLLAALPGNGQPTSFRQACHRADLPELDVRPVVRAAVRCGYVVQHSPTAVSLTPAGLAARDSTSLQHAG
jgi:hypothetical protein